MLARLLSVGLLGLESYPVTVEADVSVGLPSFDLVGLPDAAVKEAKERVRAAMKNSGFSFPVNRITINLAPADIRKAGPLYDLPILTALLIASGQIGCAVEDAVFFGELSLSGSVRPVAGALAYVLAAKEAGIERVFLPAQNAAEASVVEGIKIYPVEDIRQLAAHLSGEKEIDPVLQSRIQMVSQPYSVDFSEVKGQQKAKRALEIAAAGGHNVLMIGPPGSGKSMLAKRLPTILPSMTFAESLETTKIHSVAGVLPQECPFITQRPFRAPHHTISAASLAGGGTVPRPGELSLAHNGVLFLDELPEFSRAAMEVLRQPLEDGVVSISRVRASVHYPCKAMVIAAMNPCPCGYYGQEGGRCSCSPAKVSRYIGRVSGPLLDRFDLHVEVNPVKFESLRTPGGEESSQAIRERVERARHIQRKRYEGTGIYANAHLTPGMIAEYCPLSEEAKDMLGQVFDKLGLSARGYHRIVKVARTIADLAGKEGIERVHLAEAVQYRTLDRKFWHTTSSLE